MEQHFAEVTEKWTALRGEVTNFSENSYQELPFHLTFLLEIPEYLVEWFALRKVDNFRFFLETFPGNINSLLFVPDSKFLEFSVEC